MFHTVGKVIQPDALTEVFTVPTGYKARVSTLFASNQQGNNKFITLYWQHAHDITHKIYVVTGYVINANDYLQFSDSMVMQSGDSIQVITEAGSLMSVMASFDLYKENTVPFMAD
tara:strand:- start:203 stop:547 length:345 start_codon:yes stop_codon:yes gene_type:complete